MKFESDEGFRHEQPELLGILLVNLGTPDSPEPSDVRRYLKEFLWDPRVVELPRPLWWLVLNLVILNTRPRRSAAAYRKIWTGEGSPLLTISLKQADALAAQLGAGQDQPVRVELGMRYGNPSITSAMGRLREAGARRILVMPLYPQYSASTTASTFDAVAATLARWRWLPELRFVNNYHDDAGYIDALAQSVREYWAEHGEPDRLIMSFHGIPRDYFLAGDPYHCECHKTARLLAEKLQLDEDRWQLTFQSRLGPRKWLEPYTDQTLKTLPAQGVRNVHVICPGFSADCLETLEEINMENREFFLSAGGQQFGYIPCLNDQPRHINALAALVRRHTEGWMPSRSAQAQEQELSQRQQRAAAMGAPQ